MEQSRYRWNCREGYNTLSLEKRKGFWHWAVKVSVIGSERVETAFGCRKDFQEAVSIALESVSRAKTGAAGFEYTFDEAGNFIYCRIERKIDEVKFENFHFALNVVIPEILSVGYWKHC